VGCLCGGDGVEGGVLVDSYGAGNALREGGVDLGGAGGEVCDGCHFGGWWWRAARCGARFEERRLRMYVSAGERDGNAGGDVTFVVGGKCEYLLSCCVHEVARIGSGLMHQDWALDHGADDDGLCKMLWVWEREEETRERNNNVGRYRRGD